MRELAARLLNTIASECVGRTYLLEAPNIIERLVEQLHAEKSDTITRQHCLGTLQKFSLRSRPQAGRDTNTILGCHVSTVLILKHAFNLRLSSSLGPFRLPPPFLPQK